MKKLAIIAMLATTIAIGGCRSTANQTSAPEMTAEAPRPMMGGEGAKMVPRGIVYRTSGDYAENVPVTLNAARNEVVSFPAPSDLSAASTPVKLADGYLLDRRGIGATTAFTRYTYDEYMKLAQAPSTAELLAAVIPGAVVTEIVELPMSATAAWSDIEKCNAYVADGFKGCKIVYKAPVVKK